MAGAGGKSPQGSYLQLKAMARVMAAQLGRRTLGSSTGRTSPLQYFSAWFCPFAQRCTIALEHHSVPYVWEEALGWTVRPSTVGEQGRTEEAAYHWKSPALLAANPSGMVPTLVEPATGRVVTESLVTIEYVDKYARDGALSSAASLMPADPAARERARQKARQLNAGACSPYYSVLCKQDPDEQLEAFHALVGALRGFGEELGERKFYLGDDLSIVDLTLLPWAYRFYVFEHYRGERFVIPRDGSLANYHAWLERCLQLDAVRRTCPDKARYLVHIEKYATNTARSKVANAVRRGVAAHEYDDARD